MDNDLVTVEVNTPNLKHQAAKLVLATIVGFAATKLVEYGYDRVTNRNSSDTTTD